MPIQTAIDSISQNQGSPFGFKNRIINGGMVIDQRNAGASVTPTASVYTCDRWYYDCSQSSKASVQQNAGSVTPPDGFTNYIGVTSTSSYSVGADDYFWLSQFIEGYNIADLGWGSSTAKTVTLSFWVRSSLTGTFGGALQNSSSTRSYPFSYTISSSNTWEYKTITVTGDTTGTWLTTNGKGIRLSIGLGVGSNRNGTAGTWAATNYASATGAVSVVGTNAATFYITGVQLEKGNQASSFDWRPYTTELQLCQRYFQKSYDIFIDKLGTITTANEVRWVASATGVGEAAPTIMLPVVMRTTPTVTFYSPNNGASGFVYNYSSATNTAMTGVNVIGSRGWSGGTTGFTAGHVVGYHYAVTSEL